MDNITAFCSKEFEYRLTTIEGLLLVVEKIPTTVYTRLTTMGQITAVSKFFKKLITIEELLLDICVK